ncbi:MAG: hypothetical protein LBI19_08030 [Oscillospiraceae bacterium]|jgi:hypothetical protein|nr:hypothetical protein [Oscillospiraceae bacterium]
MKSEKSFRRNLFGGFNTRDVVNYLTQVSKERREEFDALRAGAEKLRRERDELLAGGAVAGGVQTVAVAAEDDAERDELRIQFYEMRKERDELQMRLDTTLAERESERIAAERFERERAVFEGDRASMHDSLTRSEQEQAELASERAVWCAERAELMEERQKMLMLLERAGATQERIEREESEAAERIEQMRSQAEAVRRETARLIAESRARFDEMTERGRSSALEIVLELDRMRGFFARFPERFAEPEQILAQMEQDPRPHVRDFVPTEFEEEGSALPVGDIE